MGRKMSIHGVVGQNRLFQLCFKKYLIKKVGFVIFTELTENIKFNKTIIMIISAIICAKVWVKVGNKFLCKKNQFVRQTKEELDQERQGMDQACHPGPTTPSRGPAPLERSVSLVVHHVLPTTKYVTGLK
jgi:hypothetical protein